jgi:hypothetical protein
MSRTVHIIGAGLAGLAAAVKLAPSSDAAVVVHEATAYPGGRCRSYFDRTIGMTIDNGNHLVLSGNRSVMGFAETIGSAAHLVGPQQAEFAFVDLVSNERWTLRMNNGLPWWVFDKKRRVPGTSLGEYLRLIKLLRVAADAPVGDVIDCSGPLYHRLVHPLLLAALNIGAAPGLGGIGVGGGARDAGGRRPGMPAVDRTRRAWASPRRAGVDISSRTQRRGAAGS